MLTAGIVPCRLNRGDETSSFSLSNEQGYRRALPDHDCSHVRNVNLEKMVGSVQQSHNVGL